METNHGKGIEARLHFAHLDHDKCIDLDAGNGGEDGEGGVGDDGEERGVGEEDHHGQDTAED